MRRRAPRVTERTENRKRGDGWVRAWSRESECEVVENERGIRTGEDGCGQIKVGSAMECIDVALGCVALGVEGRNAFGSKTAYKVVIRSMAATIHVATYRKNRPCQ